MQMSEICDRETRLETYYVHGSGLMAVPYHRLNEIPELKLEFHANESRRAVLMASVRKVA